MGDVVFKGDSIAVGSGEAAGSENNHKAKENVINQHCVAHSNRLNDTMVYPFISPK